jgi:mono/diheme cytochrome c family protein
VWCYYRPAPLEAQADPSQPYEARPEWYFMFMFQLLRYFHGPYEVVGTFVLPLLFFLVLFFWPFLDRSPHRDPRRRPVAIGLLALGTAGLIGLTIFAVSTDVRMTEPAQSVTKPPRAALAGPIQRADVARVYNTDCAACHGVNGTGAQIRPGMPTIPDFTSLAWQMSQTDLEITHRIQDGNEPLMPAYRKKLSQPQILALAVYVRAFAIGPLEPAVPAPGALTQPRSPATPPAANMPAASVYRAYCLACHDTDGSGRVARKAMPDLPDFLDPKWQAAHDDAALKQSILNGKGKFMLPMKDKLGPADADQMVAYVRAFRGGQQVMRVEPPTPIVPPSPDRPTVVPPLKAVTPAAASEEVAARTRAATVLFRQYCLSCHGIDGRGLDIKPAMPTIPDFTSRAWQEGIRDPQLGVSILDGKGTLMPAFRGRVTDEQARDLGAYVRAFGPARQPTPEATTTDFEQRFLELQAQWNELERQLRELPKAPPKP